MIADAVINAFVGEYGRQPAVLVRSPGRVNLLGAHLDYNEGWVMPAAIEPAIWLAAHPTDDNRVTLTALNYQETRTFSLPDLTLHGPYTTSPWINYALGVAWAMQEAGHTPVGMQAVMVGDLPPGAGLGSSAAVEMAFVLAWEALGGLSLVDNMARVRLGQRAENDYLGLKSGMMDQYACLSGRADHLIYLDCRTLAAAWLPLPANLVVVLAHSGVQRTLVGSGYNSRPEECARAVALLQPHLPHPIRTLRDVGLDDFETHAHHLPDVLRRRAWHVVGECARVQAGAAALGRGDVGAFGRLMSQSQVSSRDNYEASVAALDVLAAAAWQTPGCLGARFAGAGYGGVMQVLAEETAVADIQAAMTAALRREVGHDPAFAVTRLADGAAVTFL